MPIIKLTVITSFSALIFSLVTIAFALAGDPKALAKSGFNPHKENADCKICHIASADKLKSWFAFDSTKKQLTSDPNEICQRCHGSNFGHATGKKTPVNHADLPLSKDATVTCATTCHNMHVLTGDSKQQFFHLRLPFDSLCISCHDK